MEEKVFGRCINKTGIALRVIDQKTIDLHFTHEELQDLTNTLNWVQCDRCDKWRVLSGTVSTNKLPEKWFCDMNTNDTLNNNCEEPEKTEAWYSLNVDVVKNRTDGFCDSEYLSVRSPRKQEKECNDAILAHLLNVSNNGEKNTPLICEHRYHDALLETTSTSTALEKARKEVLLIDAQCQKTERATGTAVSVYEGLLPLHSSPIDQKNSDTQCTTDKNTHAGTADKHPVVKSGTTSSKIGCWTPTAPINWEKKSDASLSDRFFPEMLIANETTSDSRNDAISIIDSSDDESTLFV